MIDKLSSEENQANDTFHATLEQPIVVNGQTLYPKGADVTGRVSDAKKTGRLTDPGELDLILKTVSSGGMSSNLRVQPLVIKGESHTKSNAGKIAGGAALGAVIGAIAGGGKGAAIGAGVGGAAGTGAAAATGKKPAIVDSEAVLAFTTVTDSPVASSPMGSQAPPDANAPPLDPNVPLPPDSNAPLPIGGPPPPNSSSPPLDPNTPLPPNAGEPPDTSDNVPPPASSDSLFTLRDQRIIRQCVSEHASEFRPGITTHPDLQSGEDRNLQRGGVLPADMRDKVQSLPLACVQQLPVLPGDQDRVLYEGRAMLINGRGEILDEFDLTPNP
jgi:hypothetical protein